MYAYADVDKAHPKRKASAARLIPLLQCTLSHTSPRRSDTTHISPNVLTPRTETDRLSVRAILVNLRCPRLDRHQALSSCPVPLGEQLAPSSPQIRQCSPRQDEALTWMALGTGNHDATTPSDGQDQGLGTSTAWLHRLPTSTTPCWPKANRAGTRESRLASCVLVRAPGMQRRYRRRSLGSPSSSLPPRDWAAATTSSPRRSCLPS